MNMRNAAYIMEYNQRRYYPNADSKVITKELCAKVNVPTPEIYQIISSIAELPAVEKRIHELQEFVIKPEHGSGGEGVFVIKRNNNVFQRLSDEIVSWDEIKIHISDILSGLYSLGAQPDRCIIEYKVNFDPIFKEITYRGTPDIRIISFMKQPVMAMLRLPTKESGGRANLHQGGIGVGIDLETGITKSGVCKTELITKHPDTGFSIPDKQLPCWEEILAMCSRISEVIGLNYLGSDIVLDEQRGPLLLEVNARPGLAIQLANQEGLTDKLKSILKEKTAAQ